MDRLSDEAAPEGVVSGFVAHLARALRCWRADPRLPLTVGVIWVLNITPIAIGLATGRPAVGLLGAVVSFVTLGFLGTARVWYLEIDAGRRLPAAEVVGLSRSLWKRFFGLGVYTFVLFAVPLVLAAGLRSANELAGAAALFVVGVTIDILLTFATVALSFFDMTAGDAVRHSWAVTRAQWPGAALYVLAAPIALHLTFVVFPVRDIPVALYVVVSLLILVLELACKGATVLFYSDHYLGADVLPPPEPPAVGEVTAG
jgi:hypothetical protein